MQAQGHKICVGALACLVSFMSCLPRIRFFPAVLARLKIKRSDVNFGYHTLGGSKRVYKIELNGKMRAAKVSSILVYALPRCKCICAVTDTIRQHPSTLSL